MPSIAPSPPTREPSDAWVLALSLAQCTEEGPAEPIAKALLDRLLAGGVDVNETHAGTSLLGLALYRPSWAAATSRPNEMAVVRLLLDGGADLFANADRLGEMPDGPLDAACPMSLLLYSKTFGYPDSSVGSHEIVLHRNK